MRSYPNFIPLSARTVEHIGTALKPFAFETIYGHYFDRVIAKDGKAVLEASVARYVAAIEGRRGYEKQPGRRSPGSLPIALDGWSRRATRAAWNILTPPQLLR